MFLYLEERAARPKIFEEQGACWRPPGLRHRWLLRQCLEAGGGGRGEGGSARGYLRGSDRSHLSDPHAISCHFQAVEGHVKPGDAGVYSCGDSRAAGAVGLQGGNSGSRAQDKKLGADVFSECCLGHTHTRNPSETIFNSIQFIPMSMIL